MSACTGGASREVGGAGGSDRRGSSAPSDRFGSPDREPEFNSLFASMEKGPGLTQRRLEVSPIRVKEGLTGRVWAILLSHRGAGQSLRRAGAPERPTSPPPPLGAGGGGTPAASRDCHSRPGR